MSHVKKKHAPIARSSGNYDYQSSENQCAGIQAADNETARGDIQRPKGRGRPRGSSSTVSSKVTKKKMGTRSCIVASKGEQDEMVMKRSNKALTVICKGDGDCAVMTTR